jgi:hypothetical protein
MDGIGSAAADQEDFVSTGMNITIKNNQNIENAYGVPGIKFTAVTQALLNQNLCQRMIIDL